MGTTNQFLSDFRTVVPWPEGKPSESRWEESRRSDQPHRGLKPSSLLRQALQWRAADRGNSAKHLDALRKGAMEKIGRATANRAGRSEIRTFLSEGARAISESLPVVKQASLESRAVIQGASRLPFVKTRERTFAVPRSMAIASAFLRSSAFEFDEQALAQTLSDLQDAIPLEMAEIWSLKAFLELVLLEEIAAKSEESADCGVSEAHSQGSNGRAGTVRLPQLLDSLTRVSDMDWKRFFEKTCRTETILRTDPPGAYGLVDHDTCEAYRAAVADLAAHSNFTQPAIAQKAVELARHAHQSPHHRGRAKERRSHVGYYLVDAGQAELRTQVGYNVSLATRIRELVLRFAKYFYLLGIEFATFAIIAVLIGLLHVKPHAWFAIVLLVLPALECAVSSVNLIVTRLFPPRRIPKLDFSKGIPDGCATVVAVPALLTSEEQVRQAVHGLEARFLANRDPNLHFALLTDLPDSERQFDEKEILVELCSQLLRDLDEKYAPARKGRLFHFHRHRTFNPADGLWMGWERKRGKLLDFNKLLLNQDDRFPVKTGEVSLLRNIRYVITLDLDTQLPPGAGHRLVGALAHPLNRAVVDPKRNVVTEGYAILQPRVDISVKSASRSRFASLLSGDSGFDIYTRAVSDVYQDLFGEGIFTGKGIYEVETFQKVLDRRFPCNAVLSHDLIEGLYARAGLVSDVEVVDDYPSHFSAFSQRKHRWVRGDWQVIFSLLPRVRTYSGQVERNPLSDISRWKIFDNLRRSLTEFATMLLFLYGWFLPPGDALRWTLAGIAVLAFPMCFQFLLTALTAGTGWFRFAFWKNLLSDCASDLVRLSVRLAFLCHQSLIDLDAVVRTLIRMKFTHRRLLEWETAADAEMGARGRNLIEAYLKCSLMMTVAIAPLVSIRHGGSLEFAVPFLFLWAASTPIGEWLNQPQRPTARRLGAKDRDTIRNAALRTWRFFREFSTAEENWLIPDTVQKAPPLIAHRISPTNLGLLLNSRLAAHDLGFLTTEEFICETEATLDTAGRMPRCNGHLYNWYETESLEPVAPLFVSTVDNGNLLCSLWTLKEGCLEILEQPLMRPAMRNALRDYAAILAESVSQTGSCSDLVAATLELKQAIEDAVAGDSFQFDSLRKVEIDLLMLLTRVSRIAKESDAAWWARELSVRITSLLSMMKACAPWLDPQFKEACSFSKLEVRHCMEEVTLESIRRANLEALARLDCNSDLEAMPAAGQATEFRVALERSLQWAEDIEKRLRAIAARAESMADEMNFQFLFDEKKKLFSIGYDAEAGALSKCNYDLLASEARSAVFAAIAKGEVPPESWFRLKRSYRSHKGQDVLLSWTGTAFEYLMPCLWMRAYPNTLVERGVRAAVRAQQKLARAKGIPWGISESSCAERNPDGYYRYHAFGVPGLAMRRDHSTGDLVVAPYATFLAMEFDRESAVRNLRWMKELGWLSEYGFYEAADFTARRNCEANGHTLVRNWMAHHQGMILVAASNLLCQSAMQRRFHAEPRVAAVERLLHERPPRVLPHEAEVDMVPDSPPARAIATQHPRTAGVRELLPKIL